MKLNRKDIIVIALLLVMLLSANIYTLLFADNFFSDYSDRLWYVLVTIIGYIGGILFFNLRTFFLILGIMQMLILPIEMSSLYLNGQPVSMPFMSWIISTNKTEAQELLISIWWIVVVVISIWILYGWLVLHISKDIKVKGRAKPIILGVLMLMLTTLSLIHFSNLNKNYTAPSKLVYAHIYAWSFGMHVGKVFPYDIYLQTFRAFKHQKEMDGLVLLKNYQFGIKHRSDQDSVLYVMVIGEAARYHNFSLNGEYERETTPLLSHQSNLVSFSHAYAEANATDLSVPLMLTRATAENQVIAYNEKTVAGAFQEAGFKVAWLSSESSPIQYLQHVLPTLDTSWIAPEETVFDESLFSPYRNLVTDKQSSFLGNSLLILQTKGSHLSYQDRYPDNFAIFEPCFKKGTANLSFNKELMTNTYDNSILYTDYVLSTLIQILDSTERCSCLIYMPDHGENLCDDERQLWVHGSYDGSIWEYHVPLLVWYSDSFQKRYPEKVEALKNNRNKKLSSKVIFHTLCDMANLYEITDRHNSLLSDSLVEQKSIKVLNGKGELIMLQ